MRTEIPPSGRMNRTATPRMRQILTISLVVSALVIGVRQLGVLERAELGAYDQFIRWQPAPPPDPRLLVVGVSEEDIVSIGKSDQVISQLLTKLEAAKPRLIGLDIYRDVPVEPGHIELITDLQVNDRAIAVCSVGRANLKGVAPPATVPVNRLGFSEVAVDLDGIMRRNLLSLTPDSDSKCQASDSFGLQVALHYLQQQGIHWEKTPEPDEYLKIGSVKFPPLTRNIGGYRNLNLDAQGYQILLNYRSDDVAQQVTLGEVLRGKVNPDLVKNRVVLIGVTAESGNDFFYTPYSAGKQGQRMPGVVLHAQMVSQILSAVLDRKPLIWVWSDPIEWLWFWLWAILGTALAWTCRRPWLLGAIAAVAVIGLGGICYLIFTQAGWIPLVPAAVSFGGGIVGVIFYRAFRPVEPVQTPVAPLSPPAQERQEANLPPPPSPENQGLPFLQGRYRIMSVLGKGGFGITYLAEDMQRPGHPICVVKQLKPSHAHEQQLNAARILFRREAEILEDLGNHDQIPRLLAYFEQAQEFYLVQEFIKGKELYKSLIPGQGWSESQVLSLLKDILPVLSFIHSKGVIHRDLKPANLIQREQDGRIVLIDFGAVKLLQSRLAELTIIPGTPPQSATIIGTLGYAPPEQLTGETVESSDIYALGIIAIQALTGLSPREIPRESSSQALLWQDKAQVSNGLAAILNKMVRHNVSDRYPTAEAVLQELNLL